MKTRFAALLLALALLLGLGVPAWASGVSREELEEACGLVLADRGAVPGQAQLDMLARTLEAAGPELVREAAEELRAAGLQPVIRWEGGGPFRSSPCGEDCRAAVTDSAVVITLRQAGERAAAHGVGHLLLEALFQRLGRSEVEARWSAAVPEGRSGLTEAFPETFARLTVQPEELLRQMAEAADGTPAAQVACLDGLLADGFDCYTGLEDMYRFYGPQQPSDWAREAVEALEGQRYTFSLPSYQAPITRGEFCALAVGMVEGQWYERHRLIAAPDHMLADYEETVNLGVFSDVPPPEAAGEGYDAYFINRAFQLGLIGGLADGSFQPDGLITRQEAAKLVAEVCHALGAEISGSGEVEFSDRELIADWAAPYVDYMVQQGIMGGLSDGRFDPLGTYSYEQAYVTVHRILTAYAPDALYGGR